MDREILFRGKSAVDNEWVEGYYFKTQIGEKEVHCITPFDKYVDRRIYQIIPETVGQYTGLTDRNGTRIFEGDIVEYEGKRYRIDYLTHYARFSAVKPNTVFCVFAYQRGEVIGNVHDDPEMIGGIENENT